MTDTKINGRLKNGLMADPLTKAYFGEFLDADDFYDLEKPDRKDYLLNAPNEAVMNLYGDPSFWGQGLGASFDELYELYGPEVFNWL